MVPEAQVDAAEQGHIPKGEGWFVLNARDARWYQGPGRASFCDLEGDQNFTQLGININVLDPGVPMAMYHWEADQEDFLVLAGEALLIIEGEERLLRQWDFLHCPAKTKHTILGAGDGPCVMLAVGARVLSVDNPDWGGYTVDEVALRHDAGVEEETTDPKEAYSRFRKREPGPYREGWLPG